MSMYVNGVGSYSTQGVGTNQQKENSKQEVKQELQQNQVDQAPENSGALTGSLDALAATNSAGVTKSSAPKTIKISDWVTPEQAERIAGFVTGFEDAIAEGMEDFMEEFPDMSEDTAMAYSIASFERENY